MSATAATPSAAAAKPAVSRRTPALTTAVDITAGFLAGINVTIVGHPLEVAKVSSV